MGGQGRAGPGGRDRRWPLVPFRAGRGAPEVARLVATGELRPVLLDVHAAASARSTFTLRLAALQLVVPPRLAAAGAVVCGPTALWLYAGGAPPARVDLALPAGAGSSRAPELHLHAVAYRPEHLWAALPGFAVTSPARTAADVARAVPHADAVCALAVLGVTTGVRPRDVEAALTALAGRSGVARARDAVATWRSLWLPAPPPERSVDAVARDPVGVEHALDAPDRADHVVEVTGGRHLEREPRDRDAVA